MMIPATLPHAPPTITPPLYHHTSPSNHLPPPQNHPPPPENHQLQNSFQTHTSHFSHQPYASHPQNHAPMADLAILLHKMQDNQEKHQEQIVHLLQSIKHTPTASQQHHSSSHSISGAVSAENLQVQGSFPIYTAATGSLLTQAFPQSSNTLLRSTEAAPSHTAASGIISPLETSILGHFPCTNGISAAAQVTSGHAQVMQVGTSSTTFIPTSYNHNHHFTPTQFSSATVPANSAEFLWPQGSLSAHHCDSCYEVCRPCTQLSNTPLRLSETIPLPFAAQSKFSPLKTPSLGQYNGSSAMNIVSDGILNDRSVINEDFSFNAQSKSQSFSIDSSHVIEAEKSRFSMQNHSENHLPSFTHQNTPLSNSPSQQCSLPCGTALQSVADISAFSDLPVLALTATPTAQGSMPATSSQSPVKNNLLPACTIKSTSPVSTPLSLHISSSFPTTTANYIGSSTVPISSGTIANTQSFVSLFNQPQNSSPVLLPPLPTPYIKGNLPAIKLSEDVYQKSISACQLNLIGRISLPKGASPLTCHALHTKLCTAWNTQKSFTITTLGRGFYCLRFKCKEDQNKAWLFGSLNLKPGSFRLQPWSNDFNPAQQKHTSYHVWITLHELSQEYWDPHLLISIASLVGTPKAIDPSTKALIFGHYARLQVEIDLMHTLPSRLLVEREGHSFEVPVTYESLPKFCQHCLNIGHLIGECNTLQKIQVAFNIDRSRVRTNKAPTQKAKQLKTVGNAKVVQNNASPHASPSNNEVCYAVHVDAGTADDINMAIQDVFGPPSPPPGSLPHNKNLPSQPSPIANTTAPIHSSNIGSKQSSHTQLENSVVPCSINYNSNKSSSSKTATKSSSCFYKTTPTPSLNRSLHQPHNHSSSSGHTPPAQPLPFTSSNKYSLLREHYLDGDGDGEARDHFSDENSMDNADELSGFYSPAARADAEYEADIAAITQQVECAHLEQDNRYSVLEQDFPPLQASHNSHPQSPSQPVDKALRINAQSSSDNSRNQQICSSSNNSSNAISDYVSSPIQTRAQRLKNGNSVLPLHKQKKQTKANKREANALARLSKSTTTHNESSDPDEFQWNVLLKDHLKRKEAAAAKMISVTDSYGQVASMVKDAVSLEQAQQIKTTMLCNSSNDDIAPHHDASKNLDNGKSVLCPPISECANAGIPHYKLYDAHI